MQERLIYILAYIPAWVFYWLGDLVSMLIHPRTGWLIPVYSTLMNWSLFFSDWGNIGVWVDSNE